MTETQPDRIGQVRDQMGAQFARIAADAAHTADTSLHTRGRRSPRLAYGALVLIVGLVIAVSTLAIPALDGISPAPDDALAITPQGGSVTVRVVDASADPAAMTSQLEAAGVDAEVTTVPVDESRIGQWVAISGWEGRPEELGGQLESHPRYLTIPKDASSLELTVGRAAEDGEAVNVLPDGGTLPEPASPELGEDQQGSLNPSSP